MLRCSEISECARCGGLNENDELKYVSSVKHNMLKNIEESRSFMKRMNRTGEITEP